jgi:hypothetical protein
MDQHRARSTVDRLPWPATELDGARLSGCSGARWPTGGGATGRGVHGESNSGLTEERVAARRPSDGDERYVWWRTTELSHYIGAEGEGGGR